MLSKIDKKMMQIKIMNSQGLNTNNLNTNDKEFKKVGDVEMNQLETIGNNKNYVDNVQDTQKQLMNNNDI